MYRRLLMLLKCILLVVIIGQAWGILSCPFMGGPGDCHRYPAGCGFWCTAAVPGYHYDCCCNVYDPITLQRIGCCEADCRIWICLYPWGGNCGNDIDFGETAVNYLPNRRCVSVSGYPMQGYCN
ncbi:hypothetical protein GG496_001036 [Candidatus Fervidibacteria bacterium JGI MDM2 JNZ-1-D12]